MKLQVTRDNLNKALVSVARVANARGTLPILGNILIQTVGNRLSVAATNLDIAITHYVGAKISQPGAITVPARLMQDFIAGLPSGVVELNLEDYKLHIQTEQYQSIINGTAAEDFPVMPDINSEKQLKLASEELRKSLQQVIFAASSDQSRPVLTGVYFHVVDGVLFVAATDSYRLAEKNLTKTKQNTQLLVPANAMQDLLRILSDNEGETQITYDEQQVIFKAGDVELVARLIEGDYPDYRQLIPQQFATQATLKRAEFLNIAKVSSLFARESGGSITIKIDEPNSNLSIHSIASQLGENNATASAKISGSGSITLNSRYLIDALQALSGDEVKFCFNGKLEASAIINPKSDDYVHIIMPLKS
ncbi:MAG: DNA polymerase III subunit beta [Candidatus Saccharimonadales bacterium]